MPVAPPSQKEISRWKERLEDRNFQRHLLNFQEHIYRIFEDLRKQTGLELIRAVIKRDEVKRLDSVVEKIRRYREKQKENDRPADFNDINDFVGIKVLCPYRKDIELVINYLYLQASKPNGFRVEEESIERARREDPYGYRGVHFTAYPMVGAPAEWIPLRCEIQIKTLIEEAWDAKTHDLTYKRESKIPEGLQGQLKAFSDFLCDAEARGENIRAEIEKISSEAKAHREIAVMTLFNNSVGAELQKLAKENKRLMPLITQRKQLTLEEVVKINEVLRRERSNGNINIEKCLVAAFVALCSKVITRRLGKRSKKTLVEFTDPGQIIFTLQLIEELSERSPDNPSVEAARSQIYWAFARFHESIVCSEQLIEKFGSIKLSDFLRERIIADFCYFVADAILFDQFVPQKTIELVRDKVQELEALWNRDKGNLKLLSVADTIGFVKIVLGSNREEITEGIALVKEVKELVYHVDNPQIKGMAEAFSLRHLHLGEKKLGIK
jgi:ppGpp synthetase/RelA/SpoT-type nucleotidyltranferase